MIDLQVTYVLYVNLIMYIFLAMTPKSMLIAHISTFIKNRISTSYVLLKPMDRWNLQIK